MLPAARINRPLRLRGGVTEEYITEEQAKQINDLIRLTGSKLDAFLKYVKAESVDKILASDHGKAITALNEKKQRIPGAEG
jgi:hypothetical protein